jgi:hypothetical protein
LRCSISIHGLVTKTSTFVFYGFNHGFGLLHIEGGICLGKYIDTPVQDFNGLIGLAIIARVFPSPSSACPSRAPAPMSRASDSQV